VARTSIGLVSIKKLIGGISILSNENPHIWHISMSSSISFSTSRCRSANIKDMVRRALALVLLCFVTVAQCQTMIGIQITGPAVVPQGSFAPALATYTVLATYSDSSQRTAPSATWTRVLNGDPNQSQTLVGNSFNISNGGFNTLFLTAIVASNGLSFTASMTVATSAAAPMPPLPPTATPVNTSIQDPYYPYQTSLFGPESSKGGINMDGAWAITTGDPNLVIGVIDMGVLSHADLVGRLLQGYNFIEGVDNGLDPGGTPPNSGCFTAWHGTGVAGVIGANPNLTGIVGINWNSQILPVRSVYSFMGSCPPEFDR